MVERAIPRVTRLLGMVTHLEEQGEATFAELAEHFGVSVDVVRRDIETLWTSGLPGYGVNDLLDFDAWAFDDGIARLTNSQGVHQVRLSSVEAVSLAAALASLVSSGAAPDSARSALDKLTQAVSGTVSVDALSRVDPGIASILRDAAASRVCVDLEYVDARGRRTERMIEPHRLVTVEGIGYVECYCHRAGDYRTLRLDRCVGAAANAQVQGYEPTDRSGFGFDAVYEAIITVSAKGRWAFEDLPGVALEPTETAEGEAIFIARFAVSNPDVVVGRVLAAADSLVSVEPPELCAAVSEAAARIHVAHQR